MALPALQSACFLPLLAFLAPQDGTWAVHDTKRPQPPSVAAGPACPSQAPSDAIALFSGKDLSAWQGSGGSPAGWSIQGGEALVKPGAGDISTKESFGDCQFHIEWMVPVECKCSGQHGCNSGVFFMNQYELQILHSNGNETYPDGMAGSLYGQHPPLVNACRPQGEWNSYDVVFRRPRFNDDGSLASPARMTVLFNGVLVQDNAVLTGSTVHAARAKYSAHADALPLRLQDHGDPIHFRNIWIRPLSGA